MACQLGNAGGQSHPGLMPQEKAPVRGALLPASLMYFCFGQLMHFCSGVDTFRSSIRGEAGCHTRVRGSPFFDPLCCRRT